MFPLNIRNILNTLSGEKPSEYLYCVTFYGIMTSNFRRDNKKRKETKKKLKQGQ